MSEPRLDRRERMAEQTRGEILSAARELFAQRGYTATSISDIAQSAGVAVQTIYSRLGSKRGMLTALIDRIDEEADVSEHLAAVAGAPDATAALRAGVRLTRAFQERCGDLIEAMFIAAGVEPELGEAVADAHRRHREGARLTYERVGELDGLRGGLDPAAAQGLIALSTTHEAWRELVRGYGLTWDQAEDWLVETLSRSLLAPE